MRGHDVSEFEYKADEPSDYRRALEAIYRDAYQRGHQTGFSLGVAEKAWLHASWPLIVLAFSFGSMLVGLVIGINVE